MKTCPALVGTILITFMQGVAAQQQVTKRLSDTEVTQIEASSANLKVSVVVKTRNVKTNDLIGDYVPGQFPDIVRVIRNLQITVNGSPIFVPRSTYADLLAVRQAEVSLAGRTPTLQLSGGDASESYVARIEFDKATVKRRVIFDPALSGKPLQETVYHLRVMQDR